MPGADREERLARTGPGNCLLPDELPERIAHERGPDLRIGGHNEDGDDERSARCLAMAGASSSLGTEAPPITRGNAMIGPEAMSCSPCEHP